MERRRFQALLDETRRVYTQSPSLAQFAALPDTLLEQEVSPNIRPSCELMLGDAALTSTMYPAYIEALLDVGRSMHWRETYDARLEGAQFMDRWGCFSIIGDRAPYVSDRLRLFIVYMPAGLVYPWHRHPAEEMYLVLAGQAVFKREGHRPEVLTQGMTMFHDSDQAHALETTDHPVLCLVAWRNHLTVLPELVPAPDE